jgi:hypothetical protein
VDFDPDLFACGVHFVRLHVAVDLGRGLAGIPWPSSDAAIHASLVHLAGLESAEASADDIGHGKVKGRALAPSAVFRHT